MYRKILVVPAAVICLVLGQAGFVQAQTPAAPTGEASPEQKYKPGTRSRAEVQAECVAALNANRTPSGECSPEPSTQTQSTRTRAEVQAECNEALKANRTPSGECSPEPVKK